MGYESRIYIVHHHEFPATEKFAAWSYDEIIASFDFCKLGYSGLAEKFYHLFRYERGYSLFIDGKDMHEDMYGKDLCGASVSEVLSVLEEMENSEEFSGYKRRIHPAVMLLRGFKEVENLYDDLRVVFFGY